MAELDAAQASTAPIEGAREADAPIAQPTAPVVDAPAPEQAAPAPFDADAWLKQLESAPDDVYDRLVQLDPLRKRVSAESSRAIQKAQQQATQEREQREALERDLILADEDHPDHYTYVAKYGEVARDQAKEHVGIRAALQQPQVRAQASIEVGQRTLASLQAHEALKDLAAEDWDAALQTPDFGRALGDAFERAYQKRVARELPAYKQQAVDEFRARVLPNADLGGTLSGRPSTGLTAAAYREMRMRSDPALKNIPAAEIDRLSAELLRAGN